jgi:hypothetical protein
VLWYILIHPPTHDQPTQPLSSNPTPTNRAALAAAAEDAANAAALFPNGVTAVGTIAGEATAAAAAATAASTPNPLAAARKLSASKHLLVRNDSFTEMRHQQQAEMAAKIAAGVKPDPSSSSSSFLAPEGAAAATVAETASPPVVAPAEEEVPVVDGKDEGVVAGVGARMAAAS